MLSVRRRQEDAGGRVAAAQTQQLRGGLGMDDDAELEEGEACGDDTAFVDPDVALSYIDEKLQDVLGHFQKDFGGVSAEKKIKPESKYNASNFEGSNFINERGPAVSRSMGKVSGKETLPYDTNGENNSKNEVKKMQREQKTNASRSSDFLEDEKHVDSSAAVKERKSDMQSKSSHTGKKPKTKSHRDVRDNLPEGSYGSKERDTLENESALGDPRPKEKPWKYDSERDSDAPGILRREISSSVKHDKHLASEEQKMHIPPPSTVSTANAAPVVIEEHWVSCDICYKWRLLHYEMNPSNLPRKWNCSMLYWLPGMNRCEISEEETTNALNALYVPAPANGIPAVGHPHVASSGPVTSSTPNMNGHIEQNRKRKNILSDGNFVAEGSHLTQVSGHPVSNQHASSKTKTYTDGIQYPVERHSVSKSVDPIIEKKRSKSKHHSSYSDGGDLVDRDNGLIQLTQGHASDGFHLERGFNEDLQPESGRKDSNVKNSHIPKASHHLHSGEKNNYNTDGSPMQPGRHPVDPKTSVLDECDSSMHESNKSANSLQDRNGSTHCPPDGNPLLGLPSGKEKSYIKSNKQDSQKPKPQMVCSPLKESKLDSHSTPLKPNGSKLTPQSRQYNAQNGGRHGTAKHAIPSPADTSSPSRKDNTSTAYALKEAQDLKHKANRLKEEGKELESTRLYFESALKFLHVTSLLEPPSFDGLKQGDAAQSMYSDTAKLCKLRFWAAPPLPAALPWRSSHRCCSRPSSGLPLVGGGGPCAGRARSSASSSSRRSDVSS